MIGFLRGKVGLLVWLGIFLISAVVLTAGGYLMHARGLSLKPVWWFAGFMLLIGFPQLAYHTIVAITSPDPSIPSSPATVPTIAGIDNPETLFTVTPEGATVVDIPPQAAAGVLGRSEEGRLLTMPNGDTVMIARFRSGAESERAVGDYLRESGLENSARPDAEGGFTIPGNDRRFARVYARNSILVVHTAVELSPGPQNRPLTPPDPMKRLTASTSGKILAASALLLYTLFVSAYFLKGLAWATRVEAKPVERVLSASELRARLLALNTLDIPFHIEVSNDEVLSAPWKYADAKWVDQARAHGVRRIHRIRMTLDEAERKIRATDFQSSYDWSAGSGNAGLAWKATTGVVLFQYEHQRVYGLRLDNQGRATPQFSYAYTFDLQEMKSPLIETVSQAGWRWQPVAWQGPVWLRWFTE